MDRPKRTRVHREIRYHHSENQTWPDRENVDRRIDDDDDGGGSDVREPRRPLPVDGSGAAEIDPHVPR
jgi:hypothetical protein